MKTAVLLAAVAITSSASASPATSGFSFGRFGGNIRALAVRISPAGQVFVNGGRTRALTQAQLSALQRLVQTEGFSTLPKRIACAGVLPDIAWRYVTARVNGSARRVTAHGGCNRRFDRLYEALTRAARVAGA